MYRLIILNGPSKGERITVDPESMIIGKDDGCDLILPDTELASRHARLEQRGDELFVHDLDTMNKVILNKHEVQEARLKHGDIIELGRTRLLIQAVVQAEVQQGPELYPLRRRRGRKRTMALAASLLLVAGGTFALIQAGRYWNQESAIQEPGPPVVLSGLEPLDMLVESSAPVLELAPMPAHESVESGEPPLNDELRRIREDLSFIYEHLRQLNRGETEAPATENAIVVETPTINDVEAVMTAVEEAINVGDYEEADAMLEHLQIEHPDYLPAYRVRAELFEKRGLPLRARDQWTLILSRTAESKLYRKAVTERIRLGRLESQQIISALDAVRIQSLEQVRFRESSDYDEMRTISIQLAYDRRLGPIDPKGVRLLVYFFEQNLDTLGIALSKIQPYTEANLSALQQETRDVFTFTVSYVAPKGYYSGRDGVSRQRYYGFVARLHYFDQLVDEQARPPKLLDPSILQAAGLARLTVQHDPDETAAFSASN